MEVIVGNLRLFDIYEGFSSFHNYVHNAKLSILDLISKQFPNATFKLYEIYGKWAIIDETDNLLSTFFDRFEVVEGTSPVNSSPIDNQPKVLVDNQELSLDEAPRINFIDANLHDEKFKDDPHAIVKLNYPITKEMYQKLNEQSQLIADISDHYPQNLLEKELIDKSSELDTFSQILLIQVLRGENVCG